MKSRREFLQTASLGLVLSSLPWASSFGKQAGKRPNVILIITDDQGYGDFGVTGNPVIRTPHLDALARDSAQMTNYYVSPVCAPTRACLMTGRYNYRTRAIDTYIGRAMMEPQEVTVAEMLKAGGYATGIFGKWHLGDNYPMRPQEQGFEEALVLRGGGIGQPCDPPGGEGKYTDPVLFHNGQEVRMKGYCTDVYFSQAMAWMDTVQRQGCPFFAYLPTNAPHSPLDDVPEEFYEQYKKVDLGNDQFPQRDGHPLNHKVNRDQMARLYAMITNIDQNVGRLLTHLKERGLEEETLVLFMVDNGPQGRRYVAGMKGAKGTVYEGGIHSPLFVRWPSVLKAGHKSDRVVAHIDILPTLLEACGVTAPRDVRLDGRSFWPLLKGESVTWPDRQIVIQAHRGDQPVLHHNFAIRSQDWKLLHASGFGAESFDGAPRFELYDMKTDPLEMRDVSREHPEKVQELKRAYEAWFRDVSQTRPDNYAPPRIHVGTPYENPVTLTRQDWRHEKGGPWAEDSNGRWLLYVARSARYELALRFHGQGKEGSAVLEIGSSRLQQSFSASQESLRFPPVRLEKGDADLKVTLRLGETEKGPWQVDVVRLD
ncbi:MAG: arylsulfatase [Planctomycetes bacterium]|jgi:arylsulfatase/arylsulfatase A|nr:arylsulfatase [Planctomycetota bacterium]